MFTREEVVVGGSGEIGSRNDKLHRIVSPIYELMYRQGRLWTYFD
jgi:hypothetical protein